MKVAVVGSRTFDDYKFMKSELDKVQITTIISGGARGADSLAARYAKEKGIELIIFPADWDKYGNSAGYRRNIQIVDACDKVVAFWDKKSKGTKHTIDLAENKGKEVIVCWNSEG